MAANYVSQLIGADGQPTIADHAKHSSSGPEEQRRARSAANSMTGTSLGPLTCSGGLIENERRPRWQTDYFMLFVKSIVAQKPPIRSRSASH
jgi:hypothetical protein